MSLRARLTTAISTVLVIASMSVVPAAAAGPGGPATVDMGVRPLGNILVDQNGRTLYGFLKDNNGPSVCYGGCAFAWPPLLTTGMPIAGSGINQGQLGTTTRTDGTTQVTFNGWPLYYYFKDTAAGDMRGQWVNKLWFAFNADGSFNAKVAPYIGKASSPLGDVLVAPNGKTLYMFDIDKNGESNCYNQCEVNWPPLLTDVMPQADKGVVGSLLGTTTRKDGKMQVTYNKMPLYYWHNDIVASDWNGHAVGNVWWMVSPSGSRLAKKLPTYAKLSISNTPYGPILAGTNGRTVYMFAVDKNGQSACYGGCAKAWPPVLADIPVFVGSGVDSKLIGTVKRTDGSMQVTYNGMPLYYFVNDKVAGDLLGQNVNSVWFVLRPSGIVLKPGG